MPQWRSIDLNDTISTLPDLEEQVWIYLARPGRVAPAATREFSGDGGLTGSDKDVFWASSHGKIHVAEVTHWYPIIGEFATIPSPPPYL